MSKVAERSERLLTPPESEIGRRLHELVLDVHKKLQVSNAVPFVELDNKLLSDEALDGPAVAVNKSAETARCTVEIAFGEHRYSMDVRARASSGRVVITWYGEELVEPTDDVRAVVHHINNLLHRYLNTPKG